MIIFTLPVIAFFYYVVNILTAFYGFWLNPCDLENAPGIGGMLAAFGISLLIYSVSLLDTFFAFRRQARTRAVRKLQVPGLEDLDQ